MVSVRKIFSSLIGFSLLCGSYIPAFSAVLTRKQQLVLLRQTGRLSAALPRVLKKLDVIAKHEEEQRNLMNKQNQFLDQNRDQVVALQNQIAGLQKQLNDEKSEHKRDLAVVAGSIGLGWLSLVAIFHYWFDCLPDYQYYGSL
jgi:hypothetical protein